MLLSAWFDNDQCIVRKRVSLHFEGMVVAQLAYIGVVWLVQNLSRGCRVYFPVFVEGANLSMGDMHFSQGDGEVSFCGAIEMSGFLELRSGPPYASTVPLQPTMETPLRHLWKTSSDVDSRTPRLSVTALILISLHKVLLEHFCNYQQSASMHLPQPSQLVGLARMWFKGICMGRCEILRGGMEQYLTPMGPTKLHVNPIFEIGPLEPRFSEWLVFEGLSVDETGKQHYLDATVAFKRAVLNCIDYLSKFGYTKQQASALLSGASTSFKMGFSQHPQLCMF